jgi:hypothetical protein
MFGGRVQFEGNYEPQKGLNDMFSQMKDILNHHAPQKEPEYISGGLHPMISVDQAARELLEMLKGVAI